MRQVTDTKSSIQADEGTVPYVYQDSLGYWTIGTGILVDKRKGGGLRPEEMDFILNNRIKIAANSLVTKLPWFSNLDPVRQGALINMTFQMGIDGLLAFKNILAFIQAGNWQAASDGMLNSLWAKQTPKRATRLAQQIKTGVWQ